MSAANMTDHRTPDTNATAAVRSLLDTPPEGRTDAWIARFYASVPNAALQMEATVVFQAPDGFGYVRVRIPERGVDFEAHSISGLAMGCTERGLGIVLNAHKGQPDWVFFYGALWSLRANGRFDGDGLESNSPPRETPGQRVMLAAPSEELLPAFARPILRDYLQSAGVAEPRVVLMVDQALGPSRNLVFNLHPEDFTDQAAFRSASNRLVWFLPPGLGFITVPRGAFAIPHLL